MSISGVSSVVSASLPHQVQNPPQPGASGTSAASTPTQQIAAGNHHHRPPVTAAQPAQATVAGQPTPGSGLNTVA
jgi:hypothetical protein